MKKDTTFKLFIIILTAFILRIWFLNKPEGLYFDEYFGWLIASKDNFHDFCNAVLQNCHTPLYYIYLKIWMFLFGDDDIVLRFSSVLPSVLSVYTMFLLGREFKNNNIGFIAAGITAISSFSIYFAQEVRLYSLLILFSSITCLYFVKSAKKPVKRNLIPFFISNALICALHTLGIIFSLYLILLLFVYLYFCKYSTQNRLEKISHIIKYISPFVLIVMCLIPILYNIYTSHNLSQFWSEFSFTKVFCTVVDYFSPLQTNIVNTLSTPSEYFYKNNKINYTFILFGFIPLIIGIVTVIKAFLMKNKILNYMLSAMLMFFITLIFFSIKGEMLLITKYSAEIYPILILALAYGFMSFKSINLRKCIIVLFTLINLIYLAYSENSAAKVSRPEGHRAAVELFNYSRLKNNDFVILTYYDKEKFEKYLTDKNNYKFYSISKYDFNYSLFNEDDYSKVINEGKDLYEDFFREYPNKTIISYINNNIIHKMKKGDRIGILILNSVSFIKNEEMDEIINDYEKYKKIPIIFLIFSAIRNNLIYACKTQLKLDTITSSGDWTLYVYQKIN